MEFCFVSKTGILIPPMEVRTHSRWDSLDDISILYSNGEWKLGFQKHSRKSSFIDMTKNFVIRMGVGDKNGPSISPKVGYIKLQNELIPNMTSKIVYAF